MSESPSSKGRDYKKEFGPTGFDDLDNFSDFKLPTRELGERTILHEDKYARVEVIKYCNWTQHWQGKITTNLLDNTSKEEMDRIMGNCDCTNSSKFLITE